MARLLAVSPTAALGRVVTFRWCCWRHCPPRGSSRIAAEFMMTGGGSDHRGGDRREEAKIGRGGLLEELFGRIPDHLHRAVDGLSAADLAEAPAPGANTIGWLVWHLTRVQDHHVSELLGREQVWTSRPWPPRFGLQSDPDDTGYGHRAEQVARVRPDGAEVLIGYYEAVAARTAELLARGECRRPRSSGRRTVGSAGHTRRSLGEHRRRRHPARRPGRLRSRNPRPLKPARRSPQPFSTASMPPKAV